MYVTDIEILNGLAWTQNLDEEWRKNLKADPDLLWQYFGSQSGIMRNFPGKTNENIININSLMVVFTAIN